MFEERTRKQLLISLICIYASALTKLISESQPPLSSKMFSCTILRIRCYLIYSKYIVESTSRYYSTDSASYSDRNSTDSVPYSDCDSTESEPYPVSRSINPGP